MYVAINDIQDGHALLLIVVIMAPGFSMKWLLEVSRMKKWFTPNDLMLASFYKTSSQVFTFLETCNPYELMNLANFSLSKMTYRCSDDSLFWAPPLTCETRSWESVLNLSLFPISTTNVMLTISVSCLAWLLVIGNHTQGYFYHQANFIF